MGISSIFLCGCLSIIKWIKYDNKLKFICGLLLYSTISFSSIIENDSVFHIKPNTVFVNKNESLHLTVKKVSTDLSSFIYVKKGTIISNAESIKNGKIVYTAKPTLDQLVVNTKIRLSNFDKIHQNKKDSKKIVNTSEFKLLLPNPFKQITCFQIYSISITLTNNDKNKNKSCLDYLLLSYSKLATLVDFVYKPLFLNAKFITPLLLLYNSFFARPPPII